MRATVISVIALIALLGSVIFFSLYTTFILEDVKQKVKSYDFDNEDYKIIYEEFSEVKQNFVKEQLLLRLIISDGSLLEIDYLFSDIIEYASAENREGVMASAGRLSVSLDHLRNQSSLNLISVF